MSSRAVWVIVGILTASVLVSMLGIGSAHLHEGDFIYYQSFAEALAHGRLDLSIPGFHGIDFVTALWYLVSRSPDAHLQIQRLSALLLPVTAFLAARSLYSSREAGVLFAGVVTLAPFFSAVHVTGYTQEANLFLFFLTIWGAVRAARWTGISWALAILTKPFALMLLPLVLAYRPRSGSVLRRYGIIAVGVLLPLLYWVAQYLRTGHIVIGVHPELDAATVWAPGAKFFRNIAFAVHSFFSLHNFHYADPGATPMESFVHLSPLLLTLGIAAFLFPRAFFPDRRVHGALLASFVVGFLLTALVSVNDYYMAFAVSLLGLAAVPVLRRYPIWLPLVFLTFLYQWFYFTLQFQQFTVIRPWFYAPPVAVFLLLVWFGIRERKWVMGQVKEVVGTVGLVFGEAKK